MTDPAITDAEQPVEETMAAATAVEVRDVSKWFGEVTALDVLIVIGELTRRRVSDPQTGALPAVPPTGFAPPFYDVTGEAESPHWMRSGL